MENNEFENRKPTGTLLIKRAHPMGGTTVDVLVRDGYIQQMAPDILAAPGAAEIREGYDQLLLPGLVDAHASNHVSGLPIVIIIAAKHSYCVYQNIVLDRV